MKQYFTPGDLIIWARVDHDNFKDLDFYECESFLGIVLTSTTIIWCDGLQQYEPEPEVAVMQILKNSTTRLASG